MREAVPDPAYRQAFLRLARNLSPNGSAHQTLVVRTSGPAAPDRTVTLDPSTRAFFEQALRSDQQKAHYERAVLPLTGKLRAVDLNRGWIQLTQDETNTRVTGVSRQDHNIVLELMDQLVVVHATPRDGQLHFDRIEPYVER